MNNFDYYKKVKCYNETYIVMTILGYFFTKSQFIPVYQNNQYSCISNDIQIKKVNT